jgi:uracil-DNA glycosylase
MFKGLKRLGALFGGPAHAHPAFVELVALQDGELEQCSAASIAEHLRLCPRCREAAEIVRLDIETCSHLLGAAAQAVPAGRGLHKLLGVLRDERLLTAERERLRNVRNSRISEELRTYFGLHPADLLKATEKENPEFPAEITLLAQSLLGETAAAALLHRIDVKVGLE